MSHHLQYRPLFRSGAVSITDVCCRPDACACGPEEYSDITTIVFPRAGAFVRHVGRQQVLANCNHVLFFRSGETYRVSHPVRDGDDCTSLSFDPAILADAASRFDPSARDRPTSPVGVTHGPCWSEPGIYLQRLRQQLRGGEVEGLAVDELAIFLLEAVFDAAYRVRGDRPVRERSSVQIQRERVEAAKSYVTCHFREALALADLARAVHYSPYHLARLFRRQVGEPIHRYQNRLRLGTALEQLAEGAGDLTAIGLDLGFSSHSHFSSTFCREFGLPPSAFRQTLSPSRLRELSKNLKARSFARA
jgi:AraC-like DNA-binding protein